MIQNSDPATWTRDEALAALDRWQAAASRVARALPNLDAACAADERAFEEAVAREVGVTLADLQRALSRQVPTPADCRAVLDWRPVRVVSHGLALVA